eukprot:GILK01013551.1.p1 GENE.GILK01013551.1~~GILK01013551.1.p1  ORF type:complete len:230 (+),score=8.10 GILK01013551.1:315-1004(+)
MNYSSVFVLLALMQAHFAASQDSDLLDVAPSGGGAGASAPAMGAIFNTVGAAQLLGRSFAAAAADAAPASGGAASERAAPAAPSIVIVPPSTSASAPRVFGDVTSYYASRGQKFVGPVCQGSTISLSCPSGQAISVAASFYGRRRSTSCDGPAPFARANAPDDLLNIPTSVRYSTTCRSSYVQEVLAAVCNGRRSCSVTLNGRVLSDPCPGTPKYATVLYTCGGSCSCN